MIGVFKRNTIRIDFLVHFFVFGVTFRMSFEKG